MSSKAERLLRECRLNVQKVDTAPDNWGIALLDEFCSLCIANSISMQVFQEMIVGAYLSHLAGASLAEVEQTIKLLKQPIKAKA